jgi:flagellar hook-length control protein FliK
VDSGKPNRLDRGGPSQGFADALHDADRGWKKSVVVENRPDDATGEAADEPDARIADADFAANSQDRPPADTSDEDRTTGFATGGERLAEMDQESEASDSSGRGSSLISAGQSSVNTSTEAPPASVTGHAVAVMPGSETNSTVTLAGGVHQAAPSVNSESIVTAAESVHQTAETSSTSSTTGTRSATGAPASGGQSTAPLRVSTEAVGGDQSTAVATDAATDHRSATVIHAGATSDPSSRTPVTRRTAISAKGGSTIPSADVESDAAAPSPVMRDRAARSATMVNGSNQSGNDQSAQPRDSAAPSTPAAARASLVEAGIRLENVTGQPASTAVQSSGEGSIAPNISTGSPHLNRVITPDAQSRSALGMQDVPEIDDAPMANRIVRGLSTMVNQRGGVMNMRLDPPELGELRVQMTLNRGVVTAEFQASSAQAHAMLERNLNTLRSALESQGLTVDRLTVHVPAAGAPSFSRDDGGQGANQHTSRHQQDAAGGESRGRRDDASRQSQPQFRNAAFSSLFDGEVSNDLRDLLAAV